METATSAPKKRPLPKNPTSGAPPSDSSAIGDVTNITTKKQPVPKHPKLSPKTTNSTTEPLSTGNNSVMSSPVSPSVTYVFFFLLLIILYC